MQNSRTKETFVIISLQENQLFLTNKKGLLIGNCFLIGHTIENGQIFLKIDQGWFKASKARFMSLNKLNCQRKVIEILFSPFIWCYNLGLI